MDLQTTQLDMDILKMEKALRKICQIKINDGFLYTFFAIKELNMEHMDDPGYRVNLDLTFGTMRDRIQIDIAVGDVLDPKEESLQLYQYKGKPIFEGSVSLKVYPMETICVEKLDSVITRGGVNSRMKDYHDLILLCREKDIFNFTKLKKDISGFFAGKNITKPLPIKFSNNELEKLQILWTTHRSGLHEIADHLKLPIHIKDAIKEINNWLLKNGVTS